MGWLACCSFGPFSPASHSFGADSGWLWNPIQICRTTKIALPTQQQTKKLTTTIVSCDSGMPIDCRVCDPSARRALVMLLLLVVVVVGYSTVVGCCWLLLLWLLLPKNVATNLTCNCQPTNCRPCSFYRYKPVKCESTRKVQILSKHYGKLITTV